MLHEIKHDGFRVIARKNGAQKPGPYCGFSYSGTSGGRSHET
jgi:hypothetical protein